jgi:hypothetical protein
MKKALFGLLCFIFAGCFYSAKFAQEFDLTWLDTMSEYLGKNIADAPDSYTRDPFDKALYRRKITPGVYEGFGVNGSGIITSFVWYKQLWFMSGVLGEFSKWAEFISYSIDDEPVEQDPDEVSWLWKSKLMVASIWKGKAILSVFTPQSMGMTEAEWAELIGEDPPEKKTITREQLEKFVDDWNAFIEKFSQQNEQ